MVDFYTGDEPKELSFYGEDIPVEDSTLTAQLTDFYAASLKRTPEEVEGDIAAGLYPSLKAQARSQVDQLGLSNRESVVENILSEQPDVALAAERIRQASEGFVFGDHISPDIASLLAENSPASDIEKRVVDRVFAAERIIEGKRAESATGVMATAGYFGDQVISEGLHNVLGLTSDSLFEGAGQLKDLALEASQLLYVDISEEEFNREFSSILDRVSDAGFFTEVNPFAMEQFVAMMAEAGQGPETISAQQFQVLDIATSGLVSSAVKGVAGLRHVPSALSKVARQEDVLEAVGRRVRTGADDAVVSEGTSPTLISPAKSDEEFFTAYELQARREAEASNSILQELKQYDFGDIVDPEVLAAVYDVKLTDLKEKNRLWKRHEMDYAIRTDSFGNLLGSVVLGRRGGTPYIKREAAEKMAERVGGEVRVQTTNGSDSFVVVKEYNIPTTGLANPTNINEVATGWFSEIMSTTARTTADLDARLKRGEAQLSRAMRDLSKRYNRVKRGVKATEVQEIDGILTSLRDDPNVNWRREAVTVEEFSELYSNKYGKDPSPQVKEYYTLAMEINDTDYFINADLMLKDAVNNGEFMADLGGTMFRVKTVTPPTPETSVYDISLGKNRLFSDYNPEKVVIYEVKGAEFNPGGAGFVRYVVGNDVKTRRLFHSDVMPYNVGGHRQYTDDMRFFLKQDGDLKLATGEDLPARPKTFMGVRLEDEALDAVNSINRVVNAISSSAPRNVVEELIRKGNNWNPSVETVEDFQQFFSDYGMDVTKRVNYAGEGEPLVGTGFAEDATLGSHFRTGLNASKRRGSRPLTSYGGDPMEAVDPTTAIERGFSASIARRADQSYLHNAINGLLKVAEEKGAILNPADLVGMSPRLKMENAKFSSKTAVGKALEQERSTINFRLNNTTADVKFLQRVVRSFADYVYKKGGDKLARPLDQLAKGNPTDFFRAVAFNTKLGLFAIDQVYVQASQLVNIVSIAGPVNGARGVLSVAPLRLALVEGLSKEATSRIAKLQSPFTGLTADEFVELRDWIKHTGRDVIDQTVVEENVGLTLYKGAFSKIAKAGRTPFNEGELIARLGAAATNFLEMKKQFPAANVFDDANIRRMIQRQDILTASMTSSSAARWQKSILSVPFQFMTYHVRMMEQIFTSQILTKQEKARLIVGHSVMYGAAGIPVAGHLMDKFAFENGTEAVPFNYELIRFGMLDALLSEVTGGDTALSTRLAVGEGMFDLFKDTFSGQTSFVEVIGGPSGQITADLFTSAKTFGEHVFQGKFNYVGGDFARIGRNFTGFNRAYNFWFANRLGQYTSRRTGSAMLEDLKAVDSFLLGAGIPLKETELAWTSIMLAKGDKQIIKQHTTELLRLDSVASSLLQEEKYEEAGVVFEDMGKMIAILTPWEREEVMRGLRRQMTLPESIAKMSLDRGKDMFSSKIRELMEE